jgi:SMI1 / KNR4 family (SUKH-1)
MRNLFELNINKTESQKLIPPLNEKCILDFETQFSFKIPKNYKDFLEFSNGGHPEASSISYGGDDECADIDVFFHLTENQDDKYGVWYNTGILHSFFSGKQRIAIAQDGGGNTIFIDISDEKEDIYIYYIPEKNLVRIAHSFEEFIDNLFIDPDFI